MKALELALLKAQLENTLAECRDAYPVPEAGSELEALWWRAMGAPASVGAYVKACAASQQKEIDALKAENALLAEVNAQLRGQNDAVGEACAKYEAELERIKALEPVMVYHGACTIDCGEHGHHHTEMLKMIPAGTKLYALGSKT